MLRYVVLSMFVPVPLLMISFSVMEQELLSETRKSSFLHAVSVSCKIDESS